ncbi:acyltransferase [Bradyrhizobium liaoningense]|uniref:acyltransferase family protein n=1 Tax=Bradyrhizobium liaoningense TaxID=43992 RepID=UPI001BAD3371|nr:acyltransferase family protein [Bradyrhizobium liaoningense]MBR0739663.1 acyltransferase [Bradyrhizobium liaoningense]
MVVARHGAYRADIDGLRAVAVTAVVLFHAFPEYVPGGFAGVDVFFVISGYLISQILFTDAENGRFSLRRFYTRRIRRLFPALSVVLAFVILVGWFVLLPEPLARLGAQIAASSVFAANIYFWLQAGYFSPGSHSLPLLHLWSLGVEEQFYVAWPLIVMALLTRRRLVAVAIGVGAASFFLSVLLADRQDFDFYSPFTRAWELMAGVILAGIRLQAPSKSWLSDAAVAIGLSTLVACFMFLNPEDRYPSWRAAFPVAGTMLIIAAGRTSRLASLALEGRLAVYVGLISYPLYLWHWPLLVFAAAVKFLPLTLLERGIVVAAAVGAATATYEFLERPIRLREPSRIQFVALAGSMLAIAAAGLVVIGGNGFEWRFPAEIRTAASVGPAPSMRVGECLLNLDSQTEFSDRCIEAPRPLIVVWGDSTAASLMPGLRDLQSREQFGLAQFTANSCLPSLGSSVASACRAHNARVAQLINKLQPDLVILHGFGAVDNGWKKAVESIAEANSNVIVLGPVPAWKRQLPDQVLSYYITRRSLLPERSSAFVANLTDEVASAALFFGKQSVYISSWRVLCGVDGCLTRTPGGMLTTYDTGHLSEQGSIFLINAIAEQLLSTARSAGGRS